jgi:phosphoribosylanthranilate isomerase
MTHVKICGVTSVEDALACVQFGASAIGVNFVARSPRLVAVERARQIARAVGQSALVVGVVANMDVPAMSRLRAEAELGCLQLHGDEPPEALRELLPHAYKVVRIARAEDVALADGYPGEHVMADAKVEGALGGTGVTFDWGLVQGLARRRKLTVAGGLRPENVGEAVRRVHPFAVDVASGVEKSPGKKDLDRVRAFIDAVREADREP